MTTTFRPVSPSQITFIKTLIAERDTTAIESIVETSRTQAVAGTFSLRAASAFIEVLMTQPKSTTPVAEIPEGMHKVGDDIFKVQVAVHGSGRLYAKRLVVTEVEPHDWDTNCPASYEATFEYAPGALRLLSADTLMTLAEAKEFGALYGTCCACGRILTDEKSIEAGIGPVCGKRFAA